jgi:hypothetical protein
MLSEKNAASRKADADEQSDDDEAPAARASHMNLHVTKFRERVFGQLPF